MNSIKCPATAYNSTKFQIVPANGINLLVCTEGHVILRDCSVELDRLANTVGNVVSGVQTIVASYIQPLKKEIAELTRKINELLEKD
jgi:hypothetical protein